MGIEQGFSPEREMGFKIEQNTENKPEVLKEKITRKEAETAFGRALQLAEAKTGIKREMKENN